MNDKLKKGEIYNQKHWSTLSKAFQRKDVERSRKLEVRSLQNGESQGDKSTRVIKKTGI